MFELEIHCMISKQKEVMRNLLFSSTSMALMTSRENHLYHVEFDELFKETGHGWHIIVSKYPEISHCYCLHDSYMTIEEKYNKISQLGILNGDRIGLIEVTA